ncbi:hypothetical protein SAMN04488700_2023 [Carnobacterium iners]|uniref:YceG-like family protein n=1 Tax=Carnobacterium iners TaxID=1073423 RepID=A0A1X7NIH7_9LACT|nr:hypothetical protein [Carnobacterium iners]SEK65925.1 hypothetical protein SAMN04488114_10853 [Carnobacterium iners]SMH37632.1 hypothetical protein SAMN04488700_2023 [Carnobacterium iners]
MSKPALRFLALGFLISAIVLSGYRSFIYESQSTTKDSVAIETTKPNEEEELLYKEKYEKLLAETEVAELTKENAASSAAVESEEKPVEKPVEKPAKPVVTKATIVVNDGDPGSIAVEQVKNQGIIKDSTEFENFLEQNDYISFIRPGSYELTSEMNYEQIANVLMGR